MNCGSPLSYHSRQDHHHHHCFDLLVANKSSTPFRFSFSLGVSLPSCEVASRARTRTPCRGTKSFESIRTQERPSCSSLFFSRFLPRLLGRVHTHMEHSHMHSCAPGVHTRKRQLTGASPPPGHPFLFFFSLSISFFFVFVDALPRTQTEKGEEEENRAMEEGPRRAYIYL